MYTKRGFKKAEHPVFIIQIYQKSVLVDTYVRRVCYVWKVSSGAGPSKNVKFFTKKVIKLLGKFNNTNSHILCTSKLE